jgi:hypothetical protein
VSARAPARPRALVTAAAVTHALISRPAGKRGWFFVEAEGKELLGSMAFVQAERERSERHFPDDEFRCLPAFGLSRDGEQRRTGVVDSRDHNSGDYKLFNRGR